ncbi:MAG TPA: hypothetical protein VFV99_12260 [Kofleriaceae bacterium]|nr:hypothetical protein [Kofleriaceae bacterium]
MLKYLVASLLLTACTADVDILSEDEGATSGASVTSVPRSLTGCNGHASTTIPSDGRYVITTFGGPGDHQPMSCGGYADGTGWYAASRQRYGCGSHVKVQANGKCVVLKTDDYGPDVCVENAAHMPIIDVSPRASRELFGVSGAGWSDHLVVTVEEVPASTPLGVCAPSDGGGGGGGGGGGTAMSCASATLDRDVAAGECVQAASDGVMYQCTNGAWVAKSGTTGCTATYAWCSSPTLGKSVAPRACVQSAASGTWFQCNGQDWAKPVTVSTKEGPIGACSEWHPL